MKIYEIALYLLLVNLSVATLMGMDIIPAEIATKHITGAEFQSNVGDSIEYSNADIGMYLFGDFPRAITMLAKLFIFAPVLAGLLLSEIGMPSDISNTICTIIWVVYLVGLAQVIGKINLRGSE